MALPDGANRINDAMSAVVLSLPVGARPPRANRTNEWPAPNQSRARPLAKDAVRGLPAPSLVPGEGVVKGDARRGSGMDRHFQTLQVIENEGNGKSRYMGLYLAHVPRGQILSPWYKRLFFG